METPWDTFLFECVITGGLATVSDESSEVGWFPSGELPQPIQSGHVTRIEDAKVQRVAAFYR